MVFSPAGGVGAEVISRETEGQQGMERFNSVRQTSLDIFSPARDGQITPSLPSHICIVFNFKREACVTVYFLLCFVFYRL